MQESSVKLISDILGSTFDMLVKQAPIQSTIELVFIICLWILAFVLYKQHKYYSNNDLYDIDEPKYIAFICFCVLVGITCIISIFHLQSIINGYVWPEYWAVEKVLHSIRR